MKNLIFLSLLIVLLGFSSAVSEEIKIGRVEISFDYNRANRDYANNQFAAWIEDMEGNHIKTVFVTNFTATKGWKIRKEALPTWKSKSNIATMNKDVVDGISGATPQAGRQSFIWNGRDSNGSIVPAGEYMYFVEGNYYWDDTVLYSGKISVGSSTNNSVAAARFSTESARNYDIIDNVSAEYIPFQ